MQGIGSALLAMLVIALSVEEHLPQDVCDYHGKDDAKEEEHVDVAGKLVHDLKIPMALRAHQNLPPFSQTTLQYATAAVTNSTNTALRLAQAE
jgi:hypothetical protein